MPRVLPRAALFLLCLAGAPAWAAPEQPSTGTKVGVAAAVNPNATGQPPGASQRVLYVGLGMMADEKVITTKAGQAQVLFLDGTALTVGPNSELVIDRFVYDPKEQAGELALSAARGVFRLVGGKISKKSAVQIKTPLATIGVRGGIVVFNVQPGQPLRADFLYGDSMTVSAGGTTRTATRAGSTITVPMPGRGGPRPPAPPQPLTTNQIGMPLNQLEGTATTAPPPPPPGTEPTTDTALQQSTLPADGSDAPPPAIAPQDTSTAAPPPPPPGAPPPNSTALPPPLQPSLLPPPPTSTTSTASTTLYFFGRGIHQPPFTNFDPQTLAAVLGTSDNLPFAQADNANGSINITFVDNNTLQLPYQPGVSGLQLTAANSSTTFTAGGLSGSGSVTADATYFSFSGTDNQSQPFVVFGGRPTLSFPTSGSAAHAIDNKFNGITNLPFIPNGQLSASLGSVTAPAYLYSRYSSILTATQAAATDERAVQLQVSVGILGQGASQSSVLAGETGGYITETGNNSIALGGNFFGTSRASGSTLTTKYRSHLASALTQSYGAIYGGTAQHMVLVPDDLDVNLQAGTAVRTTGVEVALLPNSTFTAGYFAAEANSETVSGASVGSGNLSGMRTTQTLNGYAAAIVDSTGTGVSGPSTTSVFTNATGPTDVTISTDAQANRLSATFALSGNGSQLGSQSLTLRFGDPPGTPGVTAAFVDDNVFASRGSDDVATPSLASTDAFAAVKTDMLLASSGAAPLSNAGSVIPAGVSLCQCQYLKWGYWSADIAHNTAGDPTNGQFDAAHIATWVAGVLPQITDPVFQGTGSATYSGHVMGNVVDPSGNRYVAVGGFQNTWNFGTKTGTVNISNFDGVNYASTAGGISAANGRDFSGSLTSSGGSFGALTGAVQGSFFKSPTDSAAYMGGQFTASGTAYSAAGTFAAKR